MCWTGAIHFPGYCATVFEFDRSTSVFKSIIDKLIPLFLSVWRACLSNTEIGRFFQGEIEFPVYFFLLPTFDVNLFRLNSTFPHFDSKHIPFPAPVGRSAEGENSKQLKFWPAVLFIVLPSLSLHSRTHRTHKNNKMSNYCYRKTEQCEGTVDRLSWSNSLAGLSSRVLLLRGIISGIAIIFSLRLHRRNIADGF